MRRGAFVLHCRICGWPISATGTLADKSSSKRASPPEYSFLSSKKGRFFERIYLPFSSVDKAANFASVKYHLRSGANNQLIPPTNVSSTIVQMRAEPNLFGLCRVQPIEGTAKIWPIRYIFGGSPYRNKYATTMCNHWRQKRKPMQCHRLWRLTKSRTPEDEVQK